MWGKCIICALVISMYLQPLILIIIYLLYLYLSFYFIYIYFCFISEIINEEEKLHGVLCWFRFIYYFIIIQYNVDFSIRRYSQCVMLNYDATPIRYNYRQAEVMKLLKQNLRKYLPPNISINEIFYKAYKTKILMCF